MLVLLFLILGITNARAGDFLVDRTHPVRGYPNLMVATYYRKLPYARECFYYTVMYEMEPMGITWKRYRTKISFDLKRAGMSHWRTELLARRLYLNYKALRRPIPLESVEIVPYIMIVRKEKPIENLRINPEGILLRE